MMDCSHFLTKHEPVRSNECICCGRYMAEIWSCEDCDEA